MVQPSWRGFAGRSGGAAAPVLREEQLCAELLPSAAGTAEPGPLLEWHQNSSVTQGVG